MKKANNMLTGLACGLAAPAIVFVTYFSIRDPYMHLADSVQRFYESGVLSYYISLSAIVNLGLFFLFLKFNADKSARGVLGATIIYAFTILFLKVS